MELGNAANVCEMSDDASEESMSSESESDNDIETNGLIATRGRRSTAGNLYATLRANLDDEDLQKELLAEDEDDAGSYEGSAKDGDDDESLESSSEEEDAGPPKQGEDDLTGEKELQKVERAEARQKRKTQDARIKVPALQKKRVKLAHDVKAEDGSASERPRKRSDRTNWLPSATHAPIRQSGRALAVANREIIHANLKQSAERSEKQRRVMKNAAERDRGRRGRMSHLSREERLQRCQAVEQETQEQMGMWERKEAERKRLQEEALARRRAKGIEGPFVRYWSGSVVWQDDRIKVRRVSHGSGRVEAMKVEDETERVEKERAEAERAKAAEKLELERVKLESQRARLERERANNQATGLPAEDAVSGQTTPREDGSSVQSSTGAEPNLTIPRPLRLSAPPESSRSATEVESEQSMDWLQRIQEYAAQPEPAQIPAAPDITADHSPTTEPAATYTPSAPALNVAPPPGQPQPEIYPYPSLTGVPHAYQGHSTRPFPPPHQKPAEPPATFVPPAREQAQRTLVMLELFPELDAPSNPPTTKRSTKPTTSKTDAPLSVLDSDPVKSILLPSSFPPFAPEEAKYLVSRLKRRGNDFPLPPAPNKKRCAITSWPAKYRDPATGLAYADLHQYRIIRRVLAGGCQWSTLLGAWAGPSYGVMGRPAKGVPDGFAKPGDESAAKRGEAKASTRGAAVSGAVQ